MRKTFMTLSVAAALFAGQAVADQATLDNLVAAGVVLTEEQAAVIGAAEGQALLDAIAALVATSPEQAAAIVQAAVAANPGLASAIQAAATQAAPAQADAIAEAVILGQADAAPGNAPTTGDQGAATTSSAPSVSGGGSGSTTTASPN